jgi:DNA-binding beta-propeller fold protein YncE
LPGHALTQLDTIGSQVYGVVVSPDGTRGFALVNAPKRVIVLDMATDQAVDSILPLPDAYPLQGLAISPDGQTLAIGQGLHVRLFDAVSLAAKATIAVPEVIIRMAFHPTLQRLYVSAGAVQEVDLASNTVVRVLGDQLIARGAAGIAIAVDGSELYVVDNGAALLVFNLSTGGLVERTAIDGGQAFGLTLSTTQHLLYMVGGSASGLTILDQASRVPIANLAVGVAYDTGIDATGTTVVVPSIDGGVYFIQ